MVLEDFEIGDHVVVCSKKFPEQNGLTGIITEIESMRFGSSLPIRIRYDKGQDKHAYIRRGRFGEETNSYGPSDLLITVKKTHMEDTRAYLEAVAK